MQAKDEVLSLLASRDYSIVDCDLSDFQVAVVVLGAKVVIVLRGESPVNVVYVDEYRQERWSYVETVSGPEVVGGAVRVDFRHAARIWMMVFWVFLGCLS